MFCDPGQHSMANFLIIVESEHVIAAGGMT